MKKLEKLSTIRSATQDRVVYEMRLAHSVNDLIDAVTELQEQNKELWEYVTSCAKTAQVSAKEAQTDWEPVTVLDRGKVKKMFKHIPGIPQIPPEKSYTLAELREKMQDKRWFHYGTSGNEIVYKFLDWLDGQEDK